MQTENRTPAHNSTYPKVAVLWLNQVLCFYQSLCLVDSEVLLNRHLRVAAKRWRKCLRQRTNRNYVAPFCPIFRQRSGSTTAHSLPAALSANSGYNEYASNGYLLLLKATLSTQLAISARTLAASSQKKLWLK